MKKLIFILAAATLTAGSAAAQSWTDALKKVATTVADQVTDGKLTQYALTGTWNYTGPGVKFEGEDLTSELAGAALESTVVQKLEKAYALIGLKEGAGSFTFNDDDTFSAVLGSRNLSGDYEFDSSTHAITLKFSAGSFNLGSVPGHAYISGSELVLVFPVTKLVEIVTALGSKVSSLSTVSSLLKKYENVYIGFAFSK